MTQQNSVQAGSPMSFPCLNEPGIPTCLQPSEDMERCSKGKKKVE